MNPSSVKPRLELDEGESDDKYETASDEWVATKCNIPSNSDCCKGEPKQRLWNSFNSVVSNNPSLPVSQSLKILDKAAAQEGLIT